MKYLETEHEKKSFAITSVIMALILLLCLYWGLTYLDPPPENGIAVNFGTTDFGSGNVNTTETVQTAPQQTQASSDPTPTKEEVLTQEDVDAAVINQTKKPTPVKEVKETTKPKPVEAPKPSQQTTDALSSILSGPKTDGKATDGDGNTNQAGNQGKPDGSIYAPSYYGSGAGTGSGSGRWGLGGRTLSNSGKVVPNCNDEGTIVVQINVNRSGVVTNASFSARGSNTSSKCLQEAAIATAYKYRWQPDSNAPDNQVGFIVINFRTGE
jgi:periplasmic protein TonB